MISRNPTTNRRPTTAGQREARAAKKAYEARMARVFAAAADERARFNAACRAGAQPVMKTHAGDYVVTGVSEDWWYTSHPAGKTADVFNTRTWCGCNDVTWDRLLRQAGVERNPEFV